MKKFDQNEQLKNWLLRNCFLLVVILLFQNVNAQKKYHPLLKNTSWCVNNGFFWLERNDWYDAVSDSVVSSVTYKKFMHKPPNNGGITLLREDTVLKKVWKFDGTKEILLYDFNLNVGDTLYYVNINTIKLVLVKIDSINIKAGWRQRFIFNDGTIIIESVGSLFFPSEIRNIVQDDNRGVICCFQQNLNTYSANNYPCVPYGQCAVNVIPTPATCFGVCDGQTKAYFVGSGAVTYNWSNPNIYNLCSGNISVSAQDDDGCVSYSSAYIAQPPKIFITTSTTPATNGITDGSATANVTGGTQGYSYNWMPGGGTGQTANGLACGPYTVHVTDANSCTAISVATVACLTDVNELNANMNFRMYPNPTTSNITIEATTNTSYTIQLINLLGEMVYNTSQSAGAKAIIDGGTLPKGIYIVQMRDMQSNISSRQRLVLE